MRIVKTEGMFKISELIANIAKKTPAHGLSLEELMKQAGKEGMLIAAMVMTFPFLLPVSIPGTSIPFGILIVLIGISLMTNKPLKLPAKLREIRIQQKSMQKISSTAAAFLSRMERWTKPRLLGLTSSSPLCRLHRAALIISAVLLMSPLPLPMSNTIPAYGVLLFALGMLRRDGYVIIGGYCMLALTTAYFVGIGILGVSGFRILFVG